MFAAADAAPAALARALVVESPPAQNGANLGLGEHKRAHQPSEEFALADQRRPGFSGGSDLAARGDEPTTGSELEAPTTELESLSLDGAARERSGAKLSLDDLLAPAPPVDFKLTKPSTDPDERPSGTLSDWMNHSPQSPSVGTARNGSPTPAADEPTVESSVEPSRTPSGGKPPGSKPPGSKTVSDSDRATQPSLESLLSTFRGGASSAARTPAEPEAKPQEPPQRESAAASAKPANPSPAQAPADRSPATRAESAAAAPSKFEDLPVDSLTTAGADANRAKSPVRGPIADRAGNEPRGATPDTNPRRAAPITPGAVPPVPPAGSRPDEWIGGFQRPAKRWRKTRAAATVAGVLLGGLALGYGGLVAALGARGDVLGLARLAPSGLLPRSVQAVDEPPPFDAAPLASAIVNDDDAMEDPMVEPVTFQGDADAAVATDDDPLADATTPANPTGNARLIGAPSPYSLAQLTEALEGAEAARRTLSEKGLAANPEAARELGSAYGKLCQVAQVLTFVEESPGDRDWTALEAKELFMRLFSYGHAREDACALASRWLAWPQRVNGGVFFAGEFVSYKVSDGLAMITVRLSDGETILALTDRGIDVTRFFGADQIGVVGCVVENPAERVVGYEGEAQRAVWACHTIPLGAPRQD